MAITVAQLKTVYGQPLDTRWTDQELGFFITTAAEIVTVIPSESGLSTERLELIQLYLAAHLLTISAEYGGYRSQDIGEGSEEYPEYPNNGYASTRFGQMALNLDSSGKLAESQDNAKGVKKAQFRVITPV